MKIADKTVAITGAGSGIGRALALACAAGGARVAGFDWHDDAMQETARLVQQQGGRCLAFRGDVSQAADAQQFLLAAQGEFGAVDAIINNAGIIQPFIPFERLSLEQMERVMNVNFWGVVHMTRAFLPALLARPEAHIVNISSMGGFCPVPGQGFYGASKAAVKLLTESLALELQATRVGVTVVFPGGVRTNITENAPDVDAATKTKAKSSKSSYGVTPEAAAKKILAAMERGAARVTVGPDAAILDGLTRLTPVAAGRAMAALIRRAGMTDADAGQKG